MEIVFNIKNGERGGHPEIFYPRDDGSKEVEDEFWNALGGKPSQINPALPDDGTEEGKEGDM